MTITCVGKKYMKRAAQTVITRRRGTSWLWGDQSYNTGAGMSKLNRAPMWIVQNMAQDDETLTRQEAMDVTIYMNAQPRPDFDLRKHLPGAGSEPYNSTVPEEKSKKSCRISTAFPSGPGVDVLYEYCRG
jgi:cytochrome c